MWSSISGIERDTVVRQIDLFIINTVKLSYIKRLGLAFAYYIQSTQKNKFGFFGTINATAGIQRTV